MDEQLARKLLRNVRILNGFLIAFSLIIITVFAITGVLAYKVLTEIRDTKQSFTSLQDTAEENLNFRDKLCKSSGGYLRTLIEQQPDICN